MSDRRLRRSDVIARENREKRVTRISRQRLRGLIEEAVENIINEGYVEQLDKDWRIPNIPDDFMDDFNSWKENVKVDELICSMVNDVCKALGATSVRINCDRVIPLVKIHNGGKDIRTISYAKGLYIDDIRFPGTIPYNKVYKLVNIVRMICEVYGFAFQLETEEGMYYVHARDNYKESVVYHEAAFMPITIIDTDEKEP